MNSDAYWLGLGGAVVILGVVVEMLRRRHLRGKFGILWLILAITAVVLVLEPNLLTALSQLLGVHLPLNLVLFLGFIFLLVVIIQLSYEVGRLEERTRVLAEEVALLRSEVGLWRRQEEEHPHRAVLGVGGVATDSVRDAPRAAPGR